MNDNLARRQEAARPRRLSTASASEAGANVSLQDGDITEVHPARETQTGPGLLGAAAGRMERRNSVGVHQRHMPMEPLKFHIPRKTKEKQALFQHVSTESREYEDMMTILTSSYMDTSSAGCFTYSMPRLVHCELLEKEFVEKRKEMKSDGRTDKELEESYCFLLSDTAKLPQLCEKGLFVGHSWITTLGNPTKGVYLSRYSDLLQVNSFMLGATGEIIIFKVMKGKVKSIYENMKNLLDPTPRFDSHISKNASKVTSLTSYRALELTQQYFYEYSFDELRQRPRQVCPYAVVSFQFKGKDSALPSKPLAPVRLNSQSAEGSKEHAQFTVWTGDLVKGHRVLFQICLRSSSPPLLPHRLPEKLEIGRLMRLDQVTKLLPPKLFSYNVYSSSQEVVKNGRCSSLLEVVDRSRSTTSVSKLLHELEINQVVLVTPLTDKGFLILLSSVQMATPSERGESWKRCLQALFVFPESRDVAKSTLRSASSSHDASESLQSGRAVMPRLNQFVPALHFALVKARANPPPELSVGVESQAQEYLIGLNDSKVRHYPMDKYDSKLDERGKPSPPKHHKGNMDGYLRSYLYSPANYLLSVVRARQMVETYCGPEEPQQAKSRKSYGGQREATGKEPTRNPQDGQTNAQKMQQLIDLVLTCKRNAENEVSREEGGGGGGVGGGVAVQAPGRKRRLEQETAERALKFLKASQEPGRHSKIAVEGNQAPYSSLASVIGSVGLRDVDLREDGSELAATLLSLLTGLDQAAKGSANQSFCDMQEEVQRGSCPFDGVAARLGLPTNCDIDLRKQEELEEHTAGSVSSVEGFSPSSHSGEMNHHGAAGRGGRGLGRRAGAYEEEEYMREVPWVLIPITGLSSERYNHRDRNIPQDPRFQHLATATSVTTATNPPRKSPAPSPEPSPPPSPSQCPSPDPSPPPSPSQCPSPEPSPTPSPSHCPSPEPSPPPSPAQCPSPPSPSQCLSPPLSHPPSPSRCQSLEPNELRLLNKDHSGANEEQFAPTASRESSDVSKRSEESHHRREKKAAERPTSASTQPSVPPAPARRRHPSTPPPPPPTELEKASTAGRTGATREALAETLEEVKEKGEREADAGDEDVEDVMEVMHVVGGDNKQKRDMKEPVGSSVFSPAVSSLPLRPLRQIDSIVDKHLGDFSSEIQSVLQDESVQYSFPQSPHSTSNSEATALQHTLPYAPISQFSQYVSFYYPCPPVQDYVSSLQDSMDSVIKEFDDSWPSCKPATSRTNTDAALASTVSAFVSSIRAANTSKDTDEDVHAGEVTAADTRPPVSHITAPSRGGEGWQPRTNADHFPDATNNTSHAAAHGTLSVSTSASGSVYKPSAAVLHPPHTQSHWKPHQSRTLDITRTVASDGQTPDHSAARTVYAPGGEGGSSLSGAGCDVALPGYRGPPKPSTEPSHPSELSSNPASIPGPDSGPAPPAAALSSLISQLQPEVFNSLVEIIKDVRKNSLQFYLHSSEPEDPVNEDIKEHLLKQGNVEQSPVTFLHQENSDNRLLVIIKNKDIAAHVHKIPSLVTLKRHPTVVFLGIDTLDDIRNNSYNELFVAGGCIVSDEFVLNPDFMTHDRLAALLMLLEQHSSPSSIWKWKIHCKTHKKLKEQARFRRDAANLLEVLSAYQKRQIIEFLPYHHCDMDNQSPDLDCLLELQARYTQYRHTVLLTEHHFEKFPTYSSSGIIVANIEEILHDFPRLIGYHDIRDKQPIMDDMLAPKGHIHSLSPHDQPKHLLQESSSGRPLLPHFSDQLVPEASFKDGLPHHSGKDLEDLRMAISHLRAERQAKQQLLQLKQQQLQQQLQQHHSKLDSQAEMNTNPFERFLPNRAGSRHSSPPSETVQPPPGNEAVAATLELIHSALQLELEEEEKKEVEAGRRRSGGGQPGDQRDGAPVRAAGCLGENSDTSTPSANQKTAAVAGPGDQRAATKNGREEAHHHEKTTYPHAAKHGAASSSTTTCPVEGDRSRVQEEQPIRGEGAPSNNCDVGPASGASVTGSITMVTDQEDKPNLAVPHQRHHHHHLHQQTNQQLSHLQPSPHRQQQRRAGLLQHPHLPQLPGHHFAGAPLLGPLSGLGGSLLGPTPVWPGPTGAAALVWGLQQAGRDLTSSRLLYHQPAGQGGIRYRGGHRGGGFNGM